MVAFMTMTFLEGYGPFKAYYVPLYCAKVVVVACLLLFLPGSWRDLKPIKGTTPLAIAVGLGVLAMWVLVEQYLPYPKLGARTAYNPGEAIPSETVRYAFIAVRFIGLALLVPVMEELFWRSFLIRFASDQRWEEKPIGWFTPAGFAMVVGLFALAHPEWLAAALCATAYGWLVWKTRSVLACVVAHAVTNFGLGIYVMTTGHWELW
jgi:CAAX prenyl protease-like protein